MNTTRARNLGERLDAGRTADIYRWSDTEVIKLYQPWVSRKAIERERSNTQVARSMGLPVPDVGEIVTWSGRSGLILECIHGITMMQQLELDTSLVESYARRLAELHVSLNLIPADNRLPAQHDKLHGKIVGCKPLTSSEQEVILAALSRMPKGDRLCHGDFHPGNIIIAQNRFFMIDWIDASRGNPVADLARSSVLFLGHIVNSPLSSEERRLMELFHRTYLDAYWQRTDADRDEYAMWLSINAAARLGEGIDQLEDWLVAQVCEGFSLTAGHRSGSVSESGSKG